MGGLPQHGPRRRASLSVMGTLALAAVTTTWSCAGDGTDEGSWGGTIETLANGGIRVASPDKGRMGKAAACLGEKSVATQEMTLRGRAEEACGCG